jgi:catechol 2,3-dioxygenase-like lactoylglutathione lyase family enzyme
MTMELKAAHVCLEVSEFAKARAFWSPLLDAAGFAEGWSDGASYGGYTNGSMTLFFGESEPRRVVRAAPSGREFVVTDHVGFSVERREDVDAIADAMRAAGAEPLFPAQEYPEFGPGFYAVTFRDADNNVIEFGSREVPASEAPPP